MRHFRYAILIAALCVSAFAQTPTFISSPVPDQRQGSVYAQNAFSAVAAGDILAAVVTVQSNSATPVTVTGVSGASGWQQSSCTSWDAGNHYRTEIWYNLSAQAGQSLVTFNFSGAPLYSFVQMAQFRLPAGVTATFDGCGPSTPAAGAVPGSAGTINIPLTTTGSDLIVFGGGAPNYTSVASGYTTPPGTLGSYALGYGIQSVPGAYQPGFAGTTPREYQPNSSVAAIAIKFSGASAPAPTPAPVPPPSVSGMVWPANPGVAVYAGANAWGQSVTLGSAASHAASDFDPAGSAPTKLSQLANDVGFLTSVPPAPVASVAGRTGKVTIASTDITDWPQATSGFGGSLLANGANTFRQNNPDGSTQINIGGGGRQFLSGSTDQIKVSDCGGGLLEYYTSGPVTVSVPLPSALVLPGTTTQYPGCTMHIVVSRNTGTVTFSAPSSVSGAFFVGSSSPTFFTANTGAGTHSFWLTALDANTWGVDFFAN